MHTRRVRERTGRHRGIESTARPGLPHPRGISITSGSGRYTGSRDCHAPPSHASSTVALWRAARSGFRSQLTYRCGGSTGLGKARSGRREVQGQKRNTLSTQTPRSRLSAGTAPVSRLTRLMAQAGHPKPCCSQRPLTDSRRTATRRFYPPVQDSSIYIFG
jgi:hypothetical protein